MARQVSCILYLLIALAVVAVLPVSTAVSRNLDSQIPTLATDYPVTQITDRVFVIYGPFSIPDEHNPGFRNNPVIIKTIDGIVVCDPGGSAAAGKMVVQKVKSISSKPIVAVFNSHAHGDHWLGNEAIKDAYPDVVIYAHKRMKTKVEGSSGIQWLDILNKLTKGKALGTRVVAPDKTVKHGDVIKIGDISFRIHHTGSAHTEGDIMVEVMEEKVMFLGDVVRNKFFGLMEEDSSFKGNIAAIDYLLADMPSVKYFIPGHGKTGNKELLINYRTYLSTLYNDVKTLYASGAADFEMKPKIVKDLFAYKAWEGFDSIVGPHISRAYLEVEAEEFNSN